MSNGPFSGVGDFIQVMLVLLVISIPLGLWKLVEIIIWLVRHLSVSIQ